ncbi:AAA family ATPase [Embleya sp. AB8]|uniref:helix-turn-helix transcriptional regulator n=1 Tax=Embleya sp. AB8 TaxID=3156304 RepID=UPI003C74D95B
MFATPSQESERLLVGREAEIARLTDITQRLGTGRGTVLEIAGDPGIGKTRLMGVLAELAEQHGIAVARAHALRGNTVRYQVFRDACGHRSPACLAAGTDEETTFRSVRARLAKWAAAGAGAMLLLDDIHLCDPASAELAARLIHTAIPGPLVIALAHQPRRTGAHLLEALDHGVRGGSVVRIEPRPLDTDAVATLLRNMPPPEHDASPEHRGPEPGGAELGEPFPEFVTRLRAASGGNPRHLRILLAGGPHPDEWPDRPGPDPNAMLRAAVPLTAELDALAPDAAAVAAAAAVLGDPFRPEDIAQVARLELVRADVLRPLAPGGRLAFRHPLLRHVAHERAGVSALSTAHRRALDLLAARGASAVEQARHAEHLVGADASATVRLLTRGAAEVLPDAPATAVRWLRSALEKLPSGDRPTPERATLMLEYCRALSAAGRLDAARHIAHEVLRDDTCLTEELRLKACAVRAAAERQLGRFAEAEASARTALDALPRPLPARAAEPVFEYGVLHLFRGTYRQARALVDEVVAATTSAAEAAAEPATNPAAIALVRTLATVGAGYLGDTAAAIPALHDCVRLVDGMPDAVAARTPELLALLGCAELFTERFPAAAHHMRRGLTLARAGGPQQMVPHCLLGLSYADQESGRLDRAEQWALEAERVARATGATDAIAMSKAMRVGAMVWTHRRCDSPEVIALAEDGARTAQPGWWAGSAAMQLAMVRLISGDPGGCSDALLEGGGGRDLRLFQPNYHPMLLAMLSTSALLTGDAGAARRWARAGDLAADRLGLPVQRAHVDRAWAVLYLADGEHLMAATLFEQAALGFRRAGRPIHQAWTLVAGADSVEAARGPATAADWLETAVRLADLHGAVRVHEEAAAAQGRSAAARTAADHSATAGTPPAAVALLTDRERQIVALVTAGKRSRDVAEQLFLSPRTVDAHLARIYRKLNVSSRTALTSLLLRTDAADPTPDPMPHPDRTRPTGNR